MARRTPICAEQDCGEHTSRSDHPLCYLHWQAFQEGIIDECPNHPGVCMPVEHGVCRQCYGQNRRTVKTTPSVAEERERYGIGGSGWDTAYSEPKAIPLSAETVSRVLSNMSYHYNECTLSERNTIQYLIKPILECLGWDFSNPEEVREEYNPEGKRPYRNPAVDIALFEDGIPKVFVEAKRLDHDYVPDFKKQVDKYASYMKNSGIAVLTNGRFWRVSPVRNGRTENVEIIDISKESAEDVARRLHAAIGKSTSKGANLRFRPPNDIKEQLREYRYMEATRRNKPAFTIFTDETIDSIAAQKPRSERELESIKGIGPKKLREHGTAILEIVND